MLTPPRPELQAFASSSAVLYACHAFIGRRRTYRREPRLEPRRRVVVVVLALCRISPFAL